MSNAGVKVNEYGQITAKLNGLFVEFLVDTGATLSLWNDALPQTWISKEKVLIRGVVGQEIKSISTPLPTIIAEKMVWGRSVVPPNSPVSLLGRDLLQEFGRLLKSQKDLKHFPGNRGAALVMR